MPEVQNVGAVDYAQYQPSQYQNDAYVEDYSSQPPIYDEVLEEKKAASKSRLGATILATAIVGGLALWGGHAWGKKAADAEIEKATKAIEKYKSAQEAMDKVEKLAEEGNNKWWGSDDRCGNGFLNKIKEFFKEHKKTAEEIKDKVEDAADSAANNA